MQLALRPVLRCACAALGLAASVLLSNPVHAQVAFAPAETYYILGGFNNGKNIVTGDLDNDGDLDIAMIGGVSDLSLSFLQIFLNTGNGTFSQPPSQEIGVSVKGIALGDVDGDGDLDIVTSHRYAQPEYPRSFFSVRKNNGSGVFAFSFSKRSEEYSKDVALGDLDGDGDLDIVLGELNVTTHMNDGTGIFTLFQSTLVSGTVRSIAVGDIDGDLDVDVVAANTSGQVSVLKNLFGGVLANPVEFNNLAGASQEIALGNMTGNGALDIVTAGIPLLVNIFQNLGNGSFTTPVANPGASIPSSLDLADLNGDGNLDVITTNYLDRRVAVLLGTGTQSLGAPQLFPVRSASEAVATGDFDGDGKIDLAVANYKTMSILFNQTP